MQQKIVAQGMRACAYDRAGMGLSEPGPKPRDGLAIAKDLETLLKAAHEDGPFILVGHSMGGLYIRLFAVRNPDKVAGLVFVDAATPEATDTPEYQSFVKGFTRATKLAAFGAGLGLYTPVAGTWLGDKIGLPPAASAEKRRAFASRRAPYRCAAAEVDPDWPQHRRGGQGRRQARPRLAGGRGHRRRPHGRPAIHPVRAGAPVPPRLLRKRPGGQPHQPAGPEVRRRGRARD